MELCSEEATKYVWEGSIPLQIHLHESEVTTLPAPPPAMILGPRVGYLPLLTHLIKPHFGSTLPPGEDTVWFEYKGLPLKWYIPTGVLFDLLCAEPERPWNLTVHFRGHPGEILTPCEGEDNVKWSYINSLKEAAYIINGNCKNVMNMSQADQFELWQSLVKGNMDGYIRISSRLKLGPVGEDCIVRKGSSVGQPQPSAEENEISGSNRPCRIPVRLYVRTIDGDIDELEDAATVDNWDVISYINRPVEIQREDGSYITLKTAMKSLLPDIFGNDQEHDYVSEANSETTAENDQLEETTSKCRPEVQPSKKAKLIQVRIQGIEPDLNIPFYWVVNNLKNPESFLHICVFVSKTESS